MLECSEQEQRVLLGLGGFSGELLDIGIEMFARFSEGAFDYDSGDFTALTGQRPRTFAAFAEGRVSEVWRPPPRWLPPAALAMCVAAAARQLHSRL